MALASTLGSSVSLLVTRVGVAWRPVSTVAATVASVGRWGRESAAAARATAYAGTARVVPVPGPAALLEPLRRFAESHGVCVLALRLIAHGATIARVRAGQP